MIKTVTVKRRFCDFCNNEAYEWTACLGCGKDLCPEGTREVAYGADETAKPHGVRYPHSVNCSGSNDGYYCTPCDIRLSETKSDPLYNAYFQIRYLRDERERYYKEQQKVEKKAEANVIRLRAAHVQ